MDRSLLEKKALAELREIASTLELEGYQRLKKADLVNLIIDQGNGAHVSGGDTATADIPTSSIDAPAHATSGTNGDAPHGVDSDDSGSRGADDERATRVRARTAPSDGGTGRQRTRARRDDSSGDDRQRSNESG
ncbi:MAG: Rho termination factor N-terminal domain-containing protein, partial [Nitriliruptoraceae bacterium]